MDEESEWVTIVSSPTTLSLSPSYRIISQLLGHSHDIDIFGNDNPSSGHCLLLQFLIVYDDNDIREGEARVRNVKW